MVDRQDDAFVAGELRVGGQHVDEIPGHVPSLGLGPKPRQCIGRTVIIDDLDVRIFFHIGLVIGANLALRVGAAPGHDGQVDLLLRISARRDRRRSDAAGKNRKFLHGHTVSPSPVLGSASGALRAGTAVIRHPAFLAGPRERRGPPAERTRRARLIRRARIKHPARGNPV